MDSKWRQVWLWTIVVCLGIGFVSTIVSFFLNSFATLQDALAETGNLLLSFGAAAALLFAVNELRNKDR